MKHTSTEIKVKATNPDNEVEINQIIKLFREAYGGRFPLRCVYDLEFWKNNAGSRIISIVASKRQQVMAHLALRPEAHDPSFVQVCLPATLPEFQTSCLAIAETVWEKISTLAGRQNWSTLYFGAFSDIPLMQQLGHEAFRMSAVAILPNYAPLQNPRCASLQNSENRSSRSSIVVAARSFNLTNFDMSALHIPSQHAAIVEYLIEAYIGASASEPKSPTAPRPNHASAISTNIFKDCGAAHVLVKPSLLRDYSEALRPIRSEQRTRQFIFVDAGDRACPSYCDFLEASGLNFCGWVPGFNSLVYAKLEDAQLSPESFVYPQAKELAAYIAHNADLKLPPFSLPTLRSERRISA